MVTISPTSEKEIERFLEEQWTKEDEEHYGDVEWQDVHFAFIAVEGDRTVGAIMCRLQAGVIMIEDVMVGRNLRGKSIGRKLVEKVESFGREHQVHKIWGYTGKGWKAVGFFKSLGYQVTGELPNHFHKQNFVIISKNFTI